jgi:hypothetical protein
MNKNYKNETKLDVISPETNNRLPYQKPASTVVDMELQAFIAASSYMPTVTVDNYTDDSENDYE